MFDARALGKSSEHDWYRSTVLKEVVGRSGAENVNNFFSSDLAPFLSDDVFTLMSLCIIVVV